MANWFEENAPKPDAGAPDWFAANAPKPQAASPPATGSNWFEEHAPDVVKNLPRTAPPTAPQPSLLDSIKQKAGDAFEAVSRPGLGLADPGIGKRVIEPYARLATGAIDTLSEPFQGVPGVPFVTRAAKAVTEGVGDLAAGGAEFSTSPLGLLATPAAAGEVAIGAIDKALVGAGVRSAFVASMAPAAKDSFLAAVDDPTPENIGHAIVSGGAVIFPALAEAIHARGGPQIAPLEEWLTAGKDAPKQEQAPAAPRQNRAQRRAAVQPVVEGVPEAQQRVEAARPRIANDLAPGVPYEKLSPEDQQVVDELAREGNVGQDPDAPKPAEPVAQTPVAAPVEQAAPDWFAENAPKVEAKAETEPTVQAPVELTPDQEALRDKLSIEFDDVPYKDLDPEAKAHFDNLHADKFPADAHAPEAPVAVPEPTPQAEAPVVEPPKGPATEAPVADEKPQPSVAEIPISDIHVDAPRFQFKAGMGQGGAGEELRGVQKFDKEMGGIISVEKREKSGRRMTNDQVEEMIRLSNDAPRAEETQHSLFGEENVSRSLMPEKAEVSDYIRGRLSQEKKLFATVGSDSVAEQLGSHGNVIKAGENADVAEQTGQAQALYDKLSASAGDVSRVLDEAAKDIADGKDLAAVKQRAYEAIRGQLLESVRKLTGRTTERSDRDGAVREDKASTGEHSPAENPDQVSLFGEPHPDQGGLFSEPAPEVAPAPATRAEKLEARAAKVSKRISKKIKEATNSASFGPTLAADVLADFAEYGAVKIAQGALKFSAWAKEMVNDFGEEIKPHLAEIWLKAKDFHKQNQTELEDKPPEAEPKPLIAEAAPETKTAPTKSAPGEKAATPEPAKLKVSPSYDVTKNNILKHASERTRGALEERLADYEARNPERKVRTDDDVRAEAAAIDPALVAGLDVKKFKEGDTLNDAVHFAAKETLNQLSVELHDKANEVAEEVNARKLGKGTLSDEDLAAKQLEVADLERDTQRLADVLLPMRSQDGRNLRNHALAAGNSFDTSYWLSRAKRASMLPDAMDLPPDVQKKVVDITGRGKKAEKAAIEKLVADRVEKKARKQAVVVDEVKQAQKEARAAKKVEVDAAIQRIKDRLKSERGSISGKATEGPTMVDDLATVGRFYVDEFRLKFDDWKTKMVADFGPKVEQHLAGVYEQIQADKRAEVEPVTREQVVAKRYKRLLGSLDAAINGQLDHVVEPVTPDEKAAWENEPEVLRRRAKLAEGREEKAKLAQVDPTREEVVRKALASKIKSLEAAKAGQLKSTVDAITPEERAAFDKNPDVVRLRGELKAIREEKKELKGVNSPTRTEVVEKARKQMLANLRREAKGQRATVDPITPEERELWKNDPEVLKLRAKIAEDRKVPDPTSEDRIEKEKTKILAGIEKQKSGEVKPAKLPSKWELSPEERAQVDADPDVKAARADISRTLRNVQRSDAYEVIAAANKWAMFGGINSLAAHALPDKFLKTKATLLTLTPTNQAQILGNGTMLLIDHGLAKAPGVILDAVMGMATGHRTSTFEGTLGGAIKGAKEGVKEALQIIKEGSTQADFEGLNWHKQMNSGSVVFDRAVNEVMNSMGSVDHFFTKIAIESSLAEQMKLAGVTTPTDAMRARALEIGHAAVMNNHNAIADAVTNFRQTLRRQGQGKDVVGTTKGKIQEHSGKSLALAMDLALPVVRFPANAAISSVTYGPGNVMKAGLSLAKAMKEKGWSAENQRDFVNAASKGATGTAMMALGYWLWNKGILSIDHKKSEAGLGKVDEAAGKPYGLSVKIGGKYYPLDPFAPYAPMMAIGARLGKGYAENDSVGDLIAGVPMAAWKSIEDHPVLQSTKQLVDAMTDEDQGYAWRNYIGSRVASFVPGGIGQAARGLDESQRKRAGDTTAQAVKNAVMEKIPGLRNQLPKKLDITGEVVPEQRHAFFRMYGSEDKMDKDPVLKELTAKEAPVALSPQHKAETDEKFKARKAVSPGAKRKVAESDDEYAARLKREWVAIRSDVLRTMAMPKYKAADVEDQRALLEKAVTTARQRIK